VAVERASDLLGQKAYDASGRYLGRIADLVADDGDRPSIVAAVVTRPPSRTTASVNVPPTSTPRTAISEDSQQPGACAAPTRRKALQ